jgi:hypothetical protein
MNDRSPLPRPARPLCEIAHIREELRTPPFNKKGGNVMGKTIIIEEFHVTILVPAGLSRTEYAPVVRTLKSNRFQTRLREAIANLIRQHSSLKSVKFSISR